MGKIFNSPSLVAPGVAAQALGWLAAMPLSTTYRAKRALVSLLLKLAVAYDIVLDITRESADDAVLQAFRRAAKKVHPDKGGRKTDFQALQAAVCQRCTCFASLCLLLMQLCTVAPYGRLKNVHCMNTVGYTQAWARMRTSKVGGGHGGENALRRDKSSFRKRPSNAPVPLSPLDSSNSFGG